MARLLSQHEIDIASAAILRNELVAIPTETVYGLAGNAFDPTAVAKIFAAKERPTFDPLIVHVPTTCKTVEDLVACGIVDGTKVTTAVHRLANKLMATFWPGPLTIILPKGPKVPDIVTSGLDRVGVRMPAHPIAQDLLTECKVPLAAPSANRFGRISPTRPDHVERELGDRIPFILDGGPCDIGVESTVVTITEAPDTTSGNSANIWLIRPGKITKANLEHIAETRIEYAQSELAKASPGMLLSHYAPRKPMLWFDQIISGKDVPNEVIESPKKVALLVVSGTGEKQASSLKTMGLTVIQTAQLSVQSSDQEAAKNLFSSMRGLDETDADLIITTAVPSLDGLWLAINDRLKRACMPAPT